MEAAGNDPPPMETSLQLHENYLKSSNFHAVAEKYQRVTIPQISGLRLCLVWPLLLVCGHWPFLGNTHNQSEAQSNLSHNPEICPFYSEWIIVQKSEYRTLIIKDEPFFKIAELDV